MSLSLIVPTFSPTEELKDMAEDLVGYLIKNYEDEFDELIIAEDGGDISFYLMDVADVYILGSHNVGSMKNINRAFRVAKGDYIGYINSDVKNIEGYLAELCDPFYVTSPQVNEYPKYTGFNAAFAVFPRKLLMWPDSPGNLYLDESNEGSDGDWARKLLEQGLFRPVSTVTFSHPGERGPSYQWRRENWGY